MTDVDSLHWLPCSIGYTGPARVGAYFIPASTGKAGTCSTPEKRPMTSCIIYVVLGRHRRDRGRREANQGGILSRETSKRWEPVLPACCHFSIHGSSPSVFHCSGTTLSLPEAYRGHVIRKALEEEAACTPAAWRVKSAFSNLTYWKHGTDPVSADGPQKRMQFLSISQEVWQLCTALPGFMHHCHTLLMLSACGVHATRCMRLCQSKRSMRSLTSRHLQQQLARPEPSIQTLAKHACSLPSHASCGV